MVGQHFKQATHVTNENHFFSTNPLDASDRFNGQEYLKHVDDEYQASFSSCSRVMCRFLVNYCLTIIPSWFSSKEKEALHRKYIRYQHNINNIVFTTISANKFHLSRIIADKLRLFSYVIFSSVDTHCQQCMSV